MPYGVQVGRFHLMQADEPLASAGGPFNLFSWPQERVESDSTTKESTHYPPGRVRSPPARARVDKHNSKIVSTKKLELAGHLFLVFFWWLLDRPSTWKYLEEIIGIFGRTFSFVVEWPIPPHYADILGRPGRVHGRWWWLALIM